MNNFLRIASAVDVLPLLLAVRRRPDLWAADDYLRKFLQGPFGEVESIILRFPSITVYEAADAAEAQARADAPKADPAYDQHECIDRDEYRILPEARALVMNLMARVAGERLGRVMINKIKPGGRIFPHADTPAHAEYYSRFHVVLDSSPGVQFRCDDEQVYMAPGECWWFRNDLVHEVTNNSATDRIHMIVDIRTSR